jgi:pimeloyl-ACP methyl ester carboxylesterase
VSVYLGREPGFAGFPRSLAERAAPGLREFVLAPAGGHFAGFEHPEHAAEAIRAFSSKLPDDS